MAFQPGLPGSQFPSEDWMVRELKDIRQSVQQLDARSANSSGMTLDLAGKVDKGELVLDVRDFGAVGDGVTNDGAAIQAAVTAAAAQGGNLYWPAGTYLKTVNITSFHLVRHRGPGIVKHGTDLFYVEPKGAQANKLYVATSSASDTFDGISPAFALRTTKAAAAKLDNYGPILQGFWTIQVAAGTYTDRVIFSPGLDAVNTITVQGPIVDHPNVPTAIFKEGYNVGALAFKLFSVTASVTISNIKFDGYNGTTSSAGISTAEMVRELMLVNCHFVDCYWGASVQTGMVDMKGGIFTRCGYLGNTANDVPPSSRSGNGGGYRGLMYARHSIGTQDSGDVLKGPFFLNCNSGVYAQESCTGHVDWARVEDCNIGINLGISSRGNLDGTSFKRNGTDIRALGNCHVFISVNNVFGTGTDESDTKISLGSGSQAVDQNRIFTTLEQSYNTVMKIADTTFPAQNISTTSATVFYTLGLASMVWRDIGGSGLANKPKRINVKVYGELFGTAGTKVVNVRLGSSVVGLTFTATEVGVFEAEATVFFTNTATQFMAMRGYRHVGTGARTSSAQATNTLTTDTNLTAEALVGVGTDSIRIDAVDMSWG